LFSTSLLGQTPNESNRTWKTIDGKFSVDAEFVSFSDGNVKLKKNDGSEIDVPLARLCFADHGFLSQSLNWTAPGAPTIIEVPTDVASSDNAIRNKIATCVQLSKKLKINGNADDWHALPTLTSNARIEDGSRDIERVGIAPREKDLVVMIQTRDRPSEAPFSFYIRVDFQGRRSQPNFQLGISASTDQKLKVYDENEGRKTLVDTMISRVQVKIRDVVEIRIPYAVIKSELPKSIADKLSGSNCRPYIRVEAFSFDQQSRSIVDHGPSVASFRFLPNDFQLDETPPGSDRAALPISIPFDGKWLVGHGAMGFLTHLNIHAYDLYRVDHLGASSKKRQSSNNADYYSWGLPLKTPLDGRVIRIEDEHIDSKPLQKQSSRSNKVVLSVAGNDELQLHMIHLQQN